MNATPLSLVDRRMLDAADVASTDRPAAAAVAKSAFSRLLEETWRDCELRLLKFALGLGLKYDEAADVLQEVYIAALQKPPQAAGERELTQWLFQVTVNRCHLEHRRAKRRRGLWSSLTAAWKGEEQRRANTVHGELKAEVERALARLSELDRSLVVMRYFADLNSRQIGEIVGQPEATIRGRLRTARHKLAHDLADWKEDL